MTDITREEFTEIVVEFQNGLQLLAMLLDWTNIEIRRETIHQQLASFHHAYAELLRRRIAGTLDTGNVTISEANLARVSRIQELLASGLDADNVRQALPQLRDLITQCVGTLTDQTEPRVSVDGDVLSNDTL